MDRNKKRKLLFIFIGLLALVSVGIIFTNGLVTKSETIQEVMKDAVLHDTGKVSLFGIKDVNPALISAMCLTVIILLIALLIRIIVIPRFKMVPGKFQLLLEEWVGYFDSLAKTNSPGRNKFLSFYLFAAGSYVCISTLFELFGLQAINTHGGSITLPAPLSDINAAIAMGVMSYLFIMGGGIVSNGFKGLGNTLKDFSLPISWLILDLHLENCLFWGGSLLLFARSIINSITICSSNSHHSRFAFECYIAYKS